MYKIFQCEQSELRHFVYRTSSFLSKKDTLTFINISRIFRYHFFTTESKLTQSLSIFSKDDFEHKKESHLRWITNIDTTIDLIELEINWRRLYTLASLKWFGDFMTLVLRRSRNLQVLKLDFRLLPEKCYETCCHWTQMLMDRVEKEGLFELVVKGDKALDEGMEERVCRFESVSSLGLSTSFEPNKRIFEQEFPNLDRMEIVCGLEMVEPLNYYKFLERKNRKLRKVIFSSCRKYNIRKLMIPVRKAKKYVFEGIDDPKEKYGFTELLKERGTHMRSLEIKNSFLCESKFYRFDVAVLPKLRKISIDNCKGTSTCDMLLRATNCPQLREVYINNLKLTEPEVIEGIFMNCYEIREITLIFQRGDCTKTFNKGLNNIIAKIMRKYARFMPLPL